MRYLVVVGCLGALSSPATAHDACVTGYNGIPFTRAQFWDRPPAGRPPPTSSKWNLSHVPAHACLLSLQRGYTVQAGHVGMNGLSRPDILRSIDDAAVPWAGGTVDEVWGLPNSTTGGYTLRTT